MLPALLSVNSRLLERSLGVATLSQEVAARLERRYPRTLHRHVPQHVSLPAGRSLLSRAEARRALGYSDDDLLITVPGPAPSELEPLLRAVGRLGSEFPRLLLVVAGELDSQVSLATWADDSGVARVPVVTGRLSAEELVDHLVAADVVSALRFPSRGEMPATLIRALAVGRPVLVSAGTPAAAELPEGVVVPVNPGSRRLGELIALLRLLLGSATLRDAIGALARDHALAHHRLETAAAFLADFLVEVKERRPELLPKIQTETVVDGPIGGYFVDEMRFAARGLGLAASSLGLETRLVRLAGQRMPVKGER